MPDSQTQRPRRIVVAITGATGAVYGLRLLQLLGATPGVETHLVLSDAAVLTLHQETGVGRKEIEAQAHVVHKLRDIGASIASGSFQSDGMVVAPCSMKTLAAVAHGLSDNLITRAADVVLKERRRVNVLDDPEVRQGIKDYSNWPTIPQLYVKGEFIGGSDIMNEMFESGELKSLIDA